MMLRIMLLGLVASMGFELPSGPEVTSWTQSGRDWVQSRMVDLTGPEVEATRPDVGLAGCLQAEVPIANLPSIVEVSSGVSDDAAFVAASEAMATGFAADLALIVDERSPAEDGPETIANDSPTVGLPTGEELAALSVSPVEEVMVDVVAAAEVADEAAIAPDESLSRADRVSSAIDLTRQAVQAWADLIQESADETCPAR